MLIRLYLCSFEMFVKLYACPVYITGLGGIKAKMAAPVNPVDTKTKEMPFKSFQMTKCSI